MVVVRKDGDESKAWTLSNSALVLPAGKANLHKKRFFIHGLYFLVTAFEECGVTRWSMHPLTISAIAILSTCPTWVMTR